MKRATMKFFIWLLPIILACPACTLNKGQDKQSESSTNPNQSLPITIEILQSGVRSIIDENAEIKTIAAGFTWAEGTLWLKDKKTLLFSDVPENKIYSWSENKGLAVWLEPSGFTGPTDLKREGSNGLLLTKQGQLVICQHGDRRVALMDAPLTAPTAKFISLADHWNGKKLNSPNDAAFNSSGDLYFTDPPYGLPGKEQDPEKEIEFAGVYKISSSGDVALIIDSLKEPNGIAVSPDDKTMYVSDSDPEHAIWMKYTKDDTGKFKGKILHDATDLVDKVNGLPDGLKIHPSGYLFATGPGGIWIFSPEDEISARIYIPQATANCAFDDNFSHLYIAADSTVIRVSLKTQL